MRVQFGEFTIDTDTRQLWRGDVVLRLSRKAFDLLAILLEQRPKVVAKDELRERLWGATNVVDANLNNLAAEIRAALSDDAQEPRFLRTVHRVGYAFSGAAVTDTEPPKDPIGGPRQWLVWKDRTFVLTEDAAVIGRDPDCAIWIDAPGVSRRHARIRRIPRGRRIVALLEDLGSTNGTFLRGERLATPQPLEDGDAIKIGRTTVLFRNWSAGGSPTKRVRAKT